MSKRTLHAFFSSPAKRPRPSNSAPNGTDRLVTEHTKLETCNLVQEREVQGTDSTSTQYINANSEIRASTDHSTYPFPIADFPPSITQAIEDLLVTSSGKSINNQPHLDLVYFQPLIPQPTADDLFKHLRSTLPFYRVKYSITRFGKSVDINTPRFTTVFGIDDTSRFNTTSTVKSDNESVKMTELTTQIVEASNFSVSVAPAKYKCNPRPIPPSLLLLLNLTEALTGHKFNFCLVNYYATGSDSISYHSDDERFLGSNPAIASFTLGARRDFLMKHKPAAKGQPEVETSQIKLSLSSGDMVLMQGETQSNWLHSIPKRKGGDADKGRINITLRKAMVPAGTENYYRYNVGDGEVYRWNEKKKEMVIIG